MNNLGMNNLGDLGTWFRQWMKGKDFGEEPSYTPEESERHREQELRKDVQGYTQFCYATLEAARSAAQVMDTPFWKTLVEYIDRYEGLMAQQALHAKNYEDVLVARGEVRGMKALKGKLEMIVKAGEQAESALRELAHAHASSTT